MNLYTVYSSSYHTISSIFIYVQYERHVTTTRHTPLNVYCCSQYRLAAHLGSAFLLYSGMLYVALKHLVQPTSSFPVNRRLLGFGVGVSHLVFLTALSGQPCCLIQL
jgi:hypothetical protein